MLTIGVVRIRYPQDMKYLGYMIQRDFEPQKSHDKLRYRGIDIVHVVVKLMNGHGGTS